MTTKPSSPNAPENLPPPKTGQPPEPNTDSTTDNRPEWSKLPPLPDGPQSGDGFGKAPNLGDRA